jgi:hypothetical protein
VQAGRDIAVAQYEKAIQTAFREVADGLAGRATLGAQREAQEAQAAAETRRLALADLLLKNGAASALDRLDAERASWPHARPWCNCSWPSARTRCCCTACWGVVRWCPEARPEQGPAGIHH